MGKHTVADAGKTFEHSFLKNCYQRKVKSPYVLQISCHILKCTLDFFYLQSIYKEAHISSCTCSEK